MAEDPNYVSFVGKLITGQPMDNRIEINPNKNEILVLNRFGEVDDIFTDRSPRPRDLKRLRKRLERNLDGAQRVTLQQQTKK